MRRYLLPGLLLFIVCSAAGSYLFYNYWVHRYDALIEQQASVYRLDRKLVWSVIYEETFFRAWKIGAAEEVGLMQVTPTVAREWAKETGFKEYEKQIAENTGEFLRDPQRNIQIGCWYLERMREKFRDSPAEKAMMLAAYNAGASRVEEWTKDVDRSKISEAEFIERINISSTKAYVSSILKRYSETGAGNFID